MLELLPAEFSGTESSYVLHSRVCVYTRTYVWDEGRVQHVGLQSLEVDVSEDGVLFDLRSPPTLTAQSLLGVLGQELMGSGEKNK